MELDVLKRVSHKHILALIGAGNREEHPHRFLVLEVHIYVVKERLRSKQIVEPSLVRAWRLDW